MIKSSHSLILTRLTTVLAAFLFSVPTLAWTLHRLPDAAQEIDLFLPPSESAPDAPTLRAQCTQNTPDPRNDGTPFPFRYEYLCTLEAFKREPLTGEPISVATRKKPVLFPTLIFRSALRLDSGDVVATNPERTLILRIDAESLAATTLVSNPANGDALDDVRVVGGQFVFGRRGNRAWVWNSEGLLVAHFDLSPLAPRANAPRANAPGTFQFLSQVSRHPQGALLLLSEAGEVAVFDASADATQPGKLKGTLSLLDPQANPDPSIRVESLGGGIQGAPPRWVLISERPQQGTTLDVVVTHPTGLSRTTDAFRDSVEDQDLTYRWPQSTRLRRLTDSQGNEQLVVPLRTGVAQRPEWAVVSPEGRVTRESALTSAPTLPAGIVLGVRLLSTANELRVQHVRTSDFQSWDLRAHSQAPADVIENTLEIKTDAQGLTQIYFAELVAEKTRMVSLKLPARGPALIDRERILPDWILRHSPRLPTRWSPGVLTIQLQSEPTTYLLSL